MAHSWAALLAHPAFWSELSFDGAAPLSVDDETLLQLIRRSGGRLRALDISHPACSRITLESLRQALESDSLGLALTTLRTWRVPENTSQDRRRSRPVSEQLAIALADACPALTSAAVEVRGSSLRAVDAVLGALPRLGGKMVTLVEATASGEGTTTAGPLPWSELADWAAAALAASSVEQLNLEGFPLAESARSDGSAEQFAAALAAPERGLRVLRSIFGSRLDATPLLGSLCRALTATSPLTELSLNNSGISGPGAAEVAAALAPGRSRLRTLVLNFDNISEADGCVRLQFQPHCLL